MSRLLLLIPSASYRGHDFMEAAARLGVDVVVGSDQPLVLAEVSGGLTVDFDDLDAGVAEIAAYAARYPLDAIVAVDGGANGVAARAAEKLGLPHNPSEAVETARNKHRFRERLAAAGLPVPHGFRVGGERSFARPMLHAERVMFRHPITGEEVQTSVEAVEPELHRPK